MLRLSVSLAERTSFSQGLNDVQSLTHCTPFQKVFWMGVEGMSEDRSMDGKKYGNKGLIHSEQIAYRRLIICQLRGLVYGLSRLAVSVRQQVFPEAFHFRQQVRVSSLQ